MLKMLNETKVRSFDEMEDEYPRCKLLVEIRSLDDTKGRAIAVADWGSARDLSQLWEDNTNKGIYCATVGNYGGPNVITTVFPR